LSYIGAGDKRFYLFWPNRQVKNSIHYAEPWLYSRFHFTESCYRCFAETGAGQFQIARQPLPPRHLMT